MNDAFLITLIGGGMVFVGLILLWWMMDLLVRFTQDKEEKTEPAESAVPASTSEGISLNRQKAAAAAVAAALAMQRAIGSASAIEKNAISPWASIGRSRQINSSVLFSRRKKD